MTWSDDRGGATVQRPVDEPTPQTLAEREPAPRRARATVIDDPDNEPTRPAPSPLDDVVATGTRRARRKRSSTRNAIEWVVVVVCALAVAVVVKTFLIQAFYIPSTSMTPTLEVGDRVLVNKVSFDIDDVNRGDIIVFRRPDDWRAGDIDDLIKRVIGLPGETVSWVDGQVLINGEVLDEPWLPADVQTPAFDQASTCVPQCTIPDDSVFVLGDNRPNSSASNQYGPLDFEQVVGRAFVRVWPIGSIGGL